MMKISAKKYTNKVKTMSSFEPYVSPYTGLWYKDIIVGYRKRRYYVYTPSSYFPQLRTLFIFPDEKTDINEFLERSNFREIAEEKRLLLVFPILNGSKYKTEEKFVRRVVFDLYLNILNEFCAPSYDGHYFIGYEKGALFAAEYGLRNPKDLSGLAVIDSEELRDDIFDEIVSLKIKTYSREKDAKDYPVTDCVLPFLIAGNGNDRIISYFKKVNEENGVMTKRISLPDNKPVYSDVEFNRQICTELCTCVRFGKGPLGDLRPYRTVEDMGLKLSHEMMYHASFKEKINRMWAVYVPETYDGKTPLPLVLATHGFTGTFAYFARNTGFCELAEKENFIVLFSQALPNTGSRVGTPRWRSGYLNIKNPFRRSDTREALQSEIDYFNFIIQRTCEEYNVDHTRIYCTGHSNGSEMTYCISQELGTQFAAVVQVGYSVRQYQKIEDMPNSDILMPYLNIESEQDGGYDPDDSKKPIYWELKYRLIENGMSPDSIYQQEDNKEYIYRKYLNDKGMPLVNFVMYKNACHAYFPEVSQIAWDFMKHFSREHKKDILYRE